MKILFYDGSLTEALRKPNFSKKYSFGLVDADLGPTANYTKLKELSDEKFNGNILTNSLVALSHVFGWNDKEKCTDIYLWREKYHDFIRCDRLTLKEIREGHNIEKMYMAGSFDEEIVENVQ